MLQNLPFQIGKGDSDMSCKFIDKENIYISVDIENVFFPHTHKLNEFLFLLLLFLVKLYHQQVLCTMINPDR